LKHLISNLNIVKFFLLPIFAFLLVGCAPKSEIATPETNISVKKLDNLYFDKLALSQNPNDYVKDSNTTLFDSFHLKSKIFGVWNDDYTATLSESFWAEDIIKRDGYAENLQKYNLEEKKIWLKDMKSSIEVNKKGIISRNTDARALPTKRPYFYDPKKAGEGYPFDNLQLSRLYANTPIKIVAKTLDGAFYYISSSLTDGWIDSRDAMPLDEKQVEFLRESNLFVTVKDKTPIFDDNGEFIEKMQIGSFVFESKDDFYSIDGAKISKIKFDDKSFIKLPLEFSGATFASLANEMMNEPYGWGGYLDNRDCSMFMRDLFLPFGIYLPRNSHDQAMKSSEYIDLSNFSKNGKLDFVKQNAKPFLTLLYLKGHILLYLGTFDDEVIVLHDVWGFAYDKNGVEQRFVIGKPIISTLYLGSSYDNFITKKSLANRLLGIRTLH